MRRHHHDLLRLLRGITRSQEDAEDLTQEAFLRALRALDRFDLDRPFRPWLWTIGTRLALQKIARKDRSQVSLETAGMKPGEERHGEGAWMTDRHALEQMEGTLFQLDLSKALEDLEPHYRAVVLLRVLEGRSYLEIAEILGIPEGTVMSRLSRARARLRERLLGPEPGGTTDG